MIKDRQGQVVRELEGQNQLLKKLYSTSIGRCALKILVSPFITHLGGFYMSSPLSKTSIPSFIKNNSITLKGHANFADYGKDIVCASVSSIIITSVNNMMSIDEDAVKYSDDGNTLIVEIVKEDKLVYRLFDNLKELLTDLSKDYPKNIRIESEE